MFHGHFYAHVKLNGPSDPQRQSSEVKNETPFRYAHTDIRTPRGHICQRYFDSCRGRAFTSSSGAWLQCRTKHQMTRQQIIRMKMTTESIYRDDDNRDMATHQAAVLRNKHHVLGITMTARTADTNFENQLLLKLNKGFVQWTQGGSTCARLRIFLSLVYI